MPLIPALRRQRQAGLSEFEARLVYSLSSRTTRDTHKETLYQINKNKNKKKDAGL